MKRWGRSVFSTGMLALALAGCAYKPLKAPCSPDEDLILAYTEPRRAAPGRDALMPLDACGPMKPIGS